MKYDWKEYTVQELIDLDMLEKPLDGNHGSIHPKTSDYVPAGVPFIMANNLIGGSVDLKNCAFITEKQAATLRKGFAKPGDVLITHKATIGRTAIVPNTYETIILTPQVTYYRVKKGIDNRFLKYYFDSPDFQATLNNWAGTGSTRAYLGITAQHKLPVVLPPLDEQKKIANLLGGIDEKIENNDEINNNLEEQAVVLFRSWFSAFSLSPNSPRINSEFGEIPEDFTVVKVGSLPMLVTDYVANGSFASLKANVNLYQEPNYAYFIRNTDLKSGSFGVFVDQHSYEFLSKSTLYGGEIIISNVGDVGSVFLCPKLDGRMTLGNNIIMLKPEDNHLRYYLYIWFKYLQGQALIQGIKGGSAQPKFNKTDFKNTSVLIPPKDILTRFHETVAPMFETISQRQTETSRLVDLRDTLLSQLMSGKIDVSNLDR